jgi:hypothetical protein
MQRALALEPQVAVLANLSPQIHPGAVFVPYVIRIDLALRRPDDMLDARVPDRVLGTALTLSRASLPALRAALLHDSTGLPETVPDVPRDAPSGCVGVPRTHVEAGERSMLAPGSSGLTQPLPLLAQSLARPGDRFRLRYRLEPLPSFGVERVAVSKREQYAHSGLCPYVRFRPEADMTIDQHQRRGQRFPERVINLAGKKG